MSIADNILEKTPVATHLSSAEIKEQWSPDIRRRALFSARTTEQGYVQDMQEILVDVADGKINNADARAKLLHKLAEYNYTPEQGFPGDAALGIPPASGFTDLTSQLRLDLIIDTNRQMAASVAHIEGQTTASLEMYPAWRLTRIESKAEPREDWPARWSMAGDSVNWSGAAKRDYVALKNSPIWQAIGNGAGGFKDTLGNAYPPFAYSSGIGWMPVTRDEAIALGLDVDSAAERPPKGHLTPGEKEIADALQRFGSGFTKNLLKELRAV